MRIAKYVVLAVFMGIGCGEDVGPPVQACSDAFAKLKSCGAVSGEIQYCDSRALLVCLANCITAAPCAEIAADSKKNSFTLCTSACQGAGPDDFVCDDVTGAVKPAQVCDGIANCRDRSDEAYCGGGKDAGAGGASNGSGGARTSGGRPSMAGSDGGISATDGGLPAGASPECVAKVANELTTCPSLSRDGELEKCTKNTLLYSAQGCGPAWNTYLKCATQAPWTCDRGSTGCTAELTGYLSCQAEFAARTGCSRLDGSDGECGGAPPYAFGCQASIPSGCVAFSPMGAVTVACCPAFPPS